MKVLLINSVFETGSTGKICKNIYDSVVAEGDSCIIAYGRGKKINHVSNYKISNKFFVYLDAFLSRIFDNAGFNSKYVTRKFIRFIKKNNPDVIHLHNLHGYYINIPMLFKYIKTEYKGKVVWTFHDCWAFTGHCSHYSFINCDKWVCKNCKNCQSKKSYPKSYFSFSNRNYEKKKNIFSNIPNLTIITPSHWLKNEVAKSFFNKYECYVIPNGIDTKLYEQRICLSKSIIDEQFSNRKMILGVSSVWNYRKGLNIFLELNKKLPENYYICLIGVDKKQIKKLPKDILLIEKTNNFNDLLFFYQNAYVVLNPSFEETFGMVTIEALAAGCPVIVSNLTAVPEVINDLCGIVVENKSDCFLKAILEMKEFNTYSILQYSLKFDVTECCKKYISLFKGELI